jgi:DNA-binding HxlR family transcriptional regulator
MMKKMTKKAAPLSSAGQDTLCPIALAQRIVGDRWTVLVLRELFLGNHRFEDIQVQSQATPQMLTSRLKKLESDGMIERRPYNNRPLRHEYYLTEMGTAFHPVFLTLRAWGETWCKSKKQEVAIHYTHISCGKNPGLGPACQECGEVLRREELSATLSRSFDAERQERKDAFKRNVLNASENFSIK